MGLAANRRKRFFLCHELALRFIPYKEKFFIKISFRGLGREKSYKIQENSSPGCPKNRLTIPLVVRRAISVCFARKVIT